MKTKYNPKRCPFCGLPSIEDLYLIVSNEDNGYSRYEAVHVYVECNTCDAWRPEVYERFRKDVSKTRVEEMKEETILLWDTRHPL